MNFDISHLLAQWDYHPGQVVVRKFKGKDGTEKIQLRVDLGLLQMNSEGRPDGKRPFGHESLLAHYAAQLLKHCETNEGSEEGFLLKPEDCAKLQQETIQYHHRYICLYQLEDYEGVVRDTDHNLDVFDFVQRYAGNEDLAWSLQQFRPQLLMMRTRAKGELALEEGDYETCVEVIENGLGQLREFYSEQSRPDLAEQSGELLSLQAWLQEIQSKKPLSEREKLEHDLHDAVQREDYEKAAEVRDALRNLNTPDS